MSNKACRLRQALTLLYSLALVVLIWFLFNPFASTDALGNLRYIGPSAGRLMERHLEFYAGYERTAFVERAVHEFLFGKREAVESEAIRVYDEVLRYYQEHPQLEAPWEILNTKSRKLVTIAETRSQAELKTALQDFSNNPEEEVIAEAVYFAYLETDAEKFSPEIFTGASLLPIGWAADQLRKRIAAKTGNQHFADILDERLKQRGDRLRLRLMQMVMAIGLVILGGLYFMFRYRIFYIPTPWATSVLQNPWTVGEGYAVAIRAAVFGLLLWVALQLFSHQFFTPTLLSMWSTLFASIPMLWLMQRYLLKPRGLGFRSAFGLSLRQAGLRRFLVITGGLLSLEFVGLLLIGWGTWQLGFGSHWAQGVQERLVFGPQETVIWSAINIIVWIPILEEIGFRGLVYTTLRSRFTPTLAIVISALLFSALHMKSITGFLSIFWSGLLLAYAYERYHSLLPGIIMHSTGNLLYLSTILLFYR